MTPLVAQKYYIGFDRPMIINAREVRVDSTRLSASNKAHRLERSRPIDLLSSRSLALPQWILRARRRNVAESRRGFETSVTNPLGTRIIR